MAKITKNAEQPKRRNRLVKHPAHLLMRMPLDAKATLRQAARERGETMTGLILQWISTLPEATKPAP